MYWLSYAVMIVQWVMMLTLFVLVVAVLIQLFKFLKRKNTAMDVKSIKPDERDSQD